MEFLQNSFLAKDAGHNNRPPFCTTNYRYTIPCHIIGSIYTFPADRSDLCSAHRPFLWSGHLSRRRSSRPPSRPGDTTAAPISLCQPRLFPQTWTTLLSCVGTPDSQWWLRCLMKCCLEIMCFIYFIRCCHPMQFTMI